MLNYPDIIRIIVGAILFWIGVYLVSRNIKSKIAWILFIFLSSLSVYIVFVDVISIVYASNRDLAIIIERGTEWTYLLPIPIVLHLSTLTTRRTRLLANSYSLMAIYAIALILIIFGLTTNLLINENIILYNSPNFGFFSQRGPLFPVIAAISFWASTLALWNYLAALRLADTARTRAKFILATIGAALYAITGPLLVYLYTYTTHYELAVYSTSPLLIIPVIFWVVSIFFFRLVSDVDDIFNLKEFAYQSSAMLILALIYGSSLYLFAGRLHENLIFITSMFMYLIIFTHGFYDWLTTFIRDLLYNAGQGFSLITDADVNDLVRNFHEPEKLETNSLLKFASVKKQAKDGRLIDAAQRISREAIDYLKQPDFPRRTKQNLKYQILKMTMLDDADEGQILWELGFEGYPMKIMAGEDSTRKPLFKIESMSDYTAISRNAFIALKKEAIHDLAWRLSYLEKTSTK